MSKRKETITIENYLKEMCTYERIYGCEEITIGFPRQGLGNEIVDFMTMDCKGIFKCYEIKVTLSDLKSKAKKSWYGHFNYLAVSDELYKKVDDWSLYLPKNIGLIRFYGNWNDENGNIITGSNIYHQVMIKPKKQELTSEIEIMLKDSMIRSLFYKKEKYYKASDVEKMKLLEKENRKLTKEYKELNKELSNVETMLFKFERKSKISIEEFLENN